MLDRSTFENLSEDIKFSLYNEAVTNSDYLKGVISGLLTKIPNAQEASFHAVAVNNAHEEDNVKVSSSQAGTGDSVSGQAATSKQIPFSKPHLSLPKASEHKALLLGDSITNRIVAEEVSTNCIIRAYGGMKADQLLEKIINTKAKTYQAVTIAIGINDILDSDNYVQKNVISVIEKIILHSIHKFQPQNLGVANLTPLGAFHKDNNKLVTKFNDALKQMISKLSDIPDSVKVEVIDMNSAITKVYQGLHTDGIHPNVKGLTSIVELYRNFFFQYGIETANDTVTMRQRQPRNDSNIKAEKTLLQLKSLLSL